MGRERQKPDQREVERDSENLDETGVDAKVGRLLALE
jgi:hypothetical protein